MKSLLIILVLAGLYVSSWFFPSPFALWPLGNGRLILVRGQVFWEMHRGIEFQVNRGLFTVENDGCTFYYDLPGDPHQFDLIRTQDNSVVAILDYEVFGKRPLVMYNLENGESWPCDVTDEERNLLFERLKQEHPYLERSEYW